LLTAHGLEFENAHPFAPITWPEMAGVALLGGVSLAVGLYPRILLEAIEPAVKSLLAGIGQ
jgi:NADH:ubiquinone oxidoreductase subunit 4 (subunit M)